MTAEPLDEFVAALAADVRPVTRLRPVWQRLAEWLVFASALIVAGVLLLGVRRNLARSIEDPVFWLRASVTLLAGALAGAAALVVSIPGAERGVRQRALAVAAAASWVVLLAG